MPFYSFSDFFYIMKVQTISAKVFGEDSIFDVIQYENSDIPELKASFEDWLGLKKRAEKLLGRSPNIPEFITEACLCLVTDMVRFYKSKKLKNASFDCYDLVKESAVQLKGTSVKDDLTSFGPKSKWDEFYFIDFYNDGNIDGSFSLYQVSDELIYNCLVNVKENRTLKQSQELGYRPRIHMKSKVIVPNGLEPLELTDDSELMENVILPLGIEPVEKRIKLW